MLPGTYLTPKPEPNDSRRYSYRPPPADHAFSSDASSMVGVSQTLLPVGADLRPLCLPVRVVAQGQEDSCSGFATAAFREVCHRVAAGTPLPSYLSPAYAYARARIIENTFPGDNGATIASEFAVLQNYGICPESFMPYDGDATEMPSAAADNGALPFRIGQSLSVPTTDIGAIKTTLCSQQAVAITFTAFGSFESGGAKGLLPMPNPPSDPNYGGHAVLVVGYSDTNSYWIIRNSFGPEWGDQGYAYMPYGYEQFWLEAWTALAQP
jgi:hypothetical protein